MKLTHYDATTSQDESLQIGISILLTIFTWTRTHTHFDRWGLPHFALRDRNQNCNASNAFVMTTTYVLRTYKDEFITTIAHL